MGGVMVAVVSRILFAIPVLIAVVGCGGNTTKNQPGSSQGDVSTATA
jgi:hypothetical protein